MRQRASWPQSDLEKARRLVSLALDVLGGFGLPGTGVAKTAVEETARRLQEKERQERLAEVLRQAEEDFRAQARARGWDAVAAAILDWPAHRTRAFRQALRNALQKGEGEELAWVLARIPPLRRLPPVQRREAALLYARCVWARLWAEPDFRDAVRDVLFRDHVQLLQDVSARLDQLTETLPGRVADEQERRRRKQAWDALGPAVLPRPELTPENLLELLRAPYRLVDFTGTGPGRLVGEIAASFQNLSPAENRAWLLWGPGGIGKTRTAVEVARKLEGNGWRAGFVPRAGEVPEWQENLRIWTRPEAPTLLIVDYAEQRPSDELEALARAVRASSPERTSPLALLFLMRANPQDAVAGHVAGALREAGVRYEARAVPTLADPADRAALFRRARRFFRESIAPPDAPPEVEYDPEALPTAPLALLALAVLAACGDRVARSGDEVAVLTDLWERWEGARWKRTLLAQGGAGLLETPEVWAEARERIEGALAAATLGRPFAAPEEVADWWRAHFPFRACTARGERVDPGWLARRLQSLFPAPEGEAWRLPPIVPDPLADLVLARRRAGLGHLVASILPGPEDILQAHETARRLAEEAEGPVVVQWEQAGELLALVWPLRMVLELLPRASDAAIPGAREAAGAALEATARWLRETAEALPPEVAEGWLGLWERALPHPDHTLALRPFLAEFYRVRLERTPEEAAEERARLLNNLSVALSALGQREEALAATQEAVGIYRELAAANPQAFLPYLAGSLNNLGTMLSALGQREEALKATQEAVGIYRGLAAANPQAFLPDLAASLNNLGNRLSELGRREEALAATQEAVEIRRQLAAANPQAFLPYLATSLNNLGRDLSALGRREEALQATQEAVKIYRELAAANPQAFLPDLAMSLNNLGRDLSALGQREEALTATQEAVEIYRELAAANPQAFLPDLAGSLNNLGRDLSALGRREEALQATQEAVKIYRELAAANPQAFLPDLAISLNNLGSDLSALGRREEALAATREAVEIRRKLAATNPRAFLPDLARSLGMQGSVLLEAGRAQEARAAFAEGLRILLPFAQALPAAFGELAAVLLQYYLRACGEAGEEPEAGLVEEALRLLGRPAAVHPAVAGLAPLLVAVVDLARGEAGPEVARWVEGALAQMREHPEWRALAEALGRLAAGERDPQALRRGLALDPIDEQALSLAERAVGEEAAREVLAALARGADSAD